MKRYLQIALMVSVVVLCGVMSACSAVGTTSNECLARVAASEVAITAGYENTAKLFVAKTISKAAAQSALDKIDQADVLAGTAKRLCPTDQPSALQYLMNAETLISTVKTFIGGS